MKDVKKNVRNLLAVVGAVAVVKKAPVLVSGIVIGSLISNPDKVKKVAKEFWERYEAEMAKSSGEPNFSVEFDDTYESEIQM